MRFFLGAALLSIALAAPIKDEDTEIHPSFPDFPQFPSFPAFPAVTDEPEVTTTTLPEETDAPTTVPSIAHVSAGLEKLFGASTAFPTHIREDVPTTSDSPDISNDEYNARLIEYEQEVRQLLREDGIPEEAIEEYFAEKFHLMPYDNEKQVRFLQFFEKWAPKESTEETLVEPEATDEEHNAAAIKGEDEIAATLRKSGVPEAAIREFIEQEFHLLPFSLDKYTDFMAWGKRWELEQVKKFRWTSKNGGRIYLETPGEAWTVDVSEPEAQKIRENNEKIREVFGRMGLPEEAIDEFIALGLTEEPHDEKKQELAMKWMMKWQFSFPAARHMQEMGKEITNEVAIIFIHTYIGASAMQAFNMDVADGVMTQEKMNMYKEVFSQLTEFEQGLVQGVFDTVAKKIVKNYGIDIHGKEFDGDIERYGKEITDEVATTFKHTYKAASAMQAFQMEFADGVMTQEKLHFFKEVMSHLTEYEQALVQGVIDTVAKKIVTKYGIIDGKGIGTY